MLTVIRTKEGKSRWLTTSSTYFKDRDKEIVSEASLVKDVDRADADGDYGPLRWWHVKGLDIGSCDFNEVRDGMLIESGTFHNEAIARAVEKEAPNLGVSIGFTHPADQPDAEGVFHDIKRYERSLLPIGSASNPYTTFSVKEKGMAPNTPERAAKKWRAFVDTVFQGDEDSAKAYAEQISARAEEIKGSGVAFKETREKGEGGKDIPALGKARDSFRTAAEEAGRAYKYAKDGAFNLARAQINNAVGDSQSATRFLNEGMAEVEPNAYNGKETREKAEPPTNRDAYNALKEARRYAAMSKELATEMTDGNGSIQQQMTDGRKLSGFLEQGLVYARKFLQLLNAANWDGKERKDDEASEKGDSLVAKLSDLSTNVKRMFDGMNWTDDDGLQPVASLVSEGARGLLTAQSAFGRAAVRLSSVQAGIRAGSNKEAGEVVKSAKPTRVVDRDPLASLFVDAKE